MSGLYIHIPFCKKACHYCDFHFSTQSIYQDRMVSCIINEIEQKKELIHTTETIYFGGGTPSILNPNQLDRIFKKLNEVVDFSRIQECTIESNPDDINKEFLSYLKNTPIDRFSLGVQSFHEDELVYMNRAHNAKEAQSAIELIQKVGFDKLSIDLIYGMPESDDFKWKENISKVLEFEPDHISAYCLTIEPNTVLDRWIKKGKIPPIPDELGIRQFKLLIQYLENAGYDHYEISNFARSNKRALHNTNYWRGKSYVGIGPSAHSYNPLLAERSWNISNNIKYMNALEGDKLYFEKEVLSSNEQFNEFVMINLRTKEGIDIKLMEEKFGTYFLNAFLKELKSIESSLIRQSNNIVYLTTEGKLLSDHIIAQFFVV